MNLFMNYIKIKVQIKCSFITELERASEVKKIIIHCFLMSFLVPEFFCLKKSSILLQQKEPKKAIRINQICAVM